MKLLPEGYDIKIDNRMQYDGEPNSIFSVFELYKGNHYIGDYDSLMSAINSAWRMAADDVPIEEVIMSGGKDKATVDKNAMQKSLLTKDEYIALSNIFHYKFNCYAWKHGSEPETSAATFSAVVDIVETFLKRKA